MTCRYSSFNSIPNTVNTLSTFVELDLVQSPRIWGIFENFCVKNNLTVCKVTFNCQLQKKMGEQDALVAPK